MKNSYGVFYGEDKIFTTEYTVPGKDGLGIHKDSSVFRSWAGGWTDMKYGSGLAGDRFKKPENALGKSDAESSCISTGFVSLGTGGSIVMTFGNPVTDGNGSDFAVFAEHGTDTWLELAFVEVSSDGENFVRFDSLSLNQGNTFGSDDPSLISGFAGKYRTGYGTPFDLSSLADKPEVKNGKVNLKNIISVRIIDAVYGQDRDSKGNIIYDGYYYTPSTRAGFDLDAVGVIHQTFCKPGDVNGDGTVNLEDAVAVLKLLSGLPAGNICLSADVNGDMQIGFEELLFILRKATEL